MFYQKLRRYFLAYQEDRAAFQAYLAEWRERPLPLSTKKAYSPQLPNMEAKSSFAVKTQPFDFEVVTLNAQGRISSQRKKQAYFFNEDLDDITALQMVAIPGGSFLMSSPVNEERRETYEVPQHKVQIQPFFMGKHAVTQAQWKVVSTLPKVKIDLKPDPSHFKGDDRPVEPFSWFEAVEFCDRLSQKTGRNYRLPSEAEWEYACRAGTETPFHFGVTLTTDLANYRGTDWESEN